MKKIRLIELFSGIGAQSAALTRLGYDFENYRTSEWEVNAVASYRAIHVGLNENDYSEHFTNEELTEKLYQIGISTDGKVPMTKQQIARKGEKWKREVFNNFKATNNIGSIVNAKGSDLGIVEREKFTYLLTYSFPCFVGDTLVLTNKGYKEIKDLNMGDYVLTHTNDYKRVLTKKMTGTKEIWSIKGMCFDEIRCTKNHKFYVRKMERYYPTYENGKRGNKRRFLPAKWVECKDLDKTYYMGIAINQNSKIPKWNGVEYHWSDGRKSRHKNELDNLMKVSDFWWLVGRYVGDGWHRSQGGIIICCNKNKLHEITDIADKLKLNYSVVEDRTTFKVHFANKELEAFVDPIGRGAKNKEIPGFVLDLPIDLLKSFLDGYISSDGCFTQGKYKTSSVSKKLSYGIGQCVAKVYKRPFSIYRQDTKKTSVIEGRVVNQNTLYQVCWKMETKQQDKAFYEDGYIWFPLSEIRNTGEKEDVWDIEVETNHSFTANGAIAHNCQDLSVAGKGRGMSKGSGTRSGMLWEVERLLTETEELPQILLMENVPQVHSKKNMEDFSMWIEFLENKGYKNYWQDLNAKDYGVAQNRNRTFMVSFLDDVDFHFPKAFPLDKTMKDYLEETVDEKYYINNEKAQQLIEKLIVKGDLP